MGEPVAPELDIIIPVYNEGANIVPVLQSLQRCVRTPFCVTICYDHEDDDTLVAVREHFPRAAWLRSQKNRGRGAHGAVVSGFEASTAPAVLVMPADDDYNAPRIDAMVGRFRDGCDIVVGSRFLRGGSMEGCPWLKAVLVRVSSLVLRKLARLPATDASNGFRLFSRRVIEAIPVESTEGFAYSIELLVKCHRLGWPICEVPAAWRQRQRGQSRFRVLRWLPQYFVWFRYAFATTYLLRGPGSVSLRATARGVARERRA